MAGSIQNELNAALGTVAIAAKLSPGLEQAAELRQTDKQIKALDKKFEGVNKEIESLQEQASQPKVPKEKMDELIARQQEIQPTQLDLLEEQQGLYKKRFNLKPSQETASDYLQSRAAFREHSENYDQLQRIQQRINQEGGISVPGSTEAHLEDVQKQGKKQETANKTSQTVVENKKKQHRNFKEYLAKMPTNLGGTVGDLPPVVQAAIAKQYSAKDRKRMMDKEDKNGSK